MRTSSLRPPPADIADVDADAKAPFAETLTQPEAKFPAPVSAAPNELRGNENAAPAAAATDRNSRRFMPCLAPLSIRHGSPIGKQNMPKPQTLLKKHA
jgi:hypothetical protein